MRARVIAAMLLLPPAAAAAQPAPIIDMHLHALPADDQGPPPIAMCTPLPLPTWDPADGPFGAVFMGRMKAARPCADPIWSPETDEEVMRRTLAILERRNIVGVTSGPAAVLARWHRAAPQRILRAYAFNLVREAGVTPDSLRRALASGDYVALAEVTNQYTGVALDDPAYDPYLAVAEELDIPVGVHVGTGPPGAPYLGFGGYRARLHSPLTVEEALIRHPRLRVWLMHAGWPMLDDLLAVLWTHPQVYVDVGVISFVLPRAELHRYLRTIVEAGFGDRIMFGSDQMVWPEAIEVALANIEAADFLTAAQKRAILYDNAARFLRLDAEGRPRRAPAGARPSRR